MKTKKIIWLALTALVLAAAGSFPRAASASGAPADGSLDTEAPSEAGTELDEAARDEGAAGDVMDGSQGASKPSVGAEDSTPVAQPKPQRRRGPASAGSLGKTTFKPIPPKAEPSMMEKAGKGAAGTWEKLKPAITTLTLVGTVAGAALFIFGIFSLSLPLMLGGALVACAAVAIGGLVQALTP